MSRSEKELKNQHLILKNIFKPVEKGGSNIYNHTSYLHCTLLKLRLKMGMLHLGTYERFHLSMKTLVSLHLVQSKFLSNFYNYS